MKLHTTLEITGTVAVGDVVQLVPVNFWTNKIVEEQGTDEWSVVEIQRNKRDGRITRLRVASSTDTDYIRWLAFSDASFVVL